MIHDLNPYPAMKDSGVPWLGAVPAHWEVLRSKNVLSEVDERSATGLETHLSMSQKLGLVQSSQIEERRLVSESYAGAKLCECDDLVLNRLKAHLGVFALAPARGLVSPDYTVLRPNRTVEPRYIWAVYRTPDCRVELCQRVKGIVEGFWRLYTDDFYGIRVPFPPLAEQKGIVRFLDHADRRIRRYIRAKQRLIALLEEQKQAIIHRAVTRGLDPSVRLKPSGVEWLGAVPAHWEVKRTKNVLTPLDKRSVSGKETLLSLRRDHGIVVYADHFSRPPQGVTTVGFKLVQIGQLVVNRLQANNGLIFHSSLDGLVSPDYSVFEASGMINIAFLSALLRTVTYRAHFRRESTGLGTGTSGFLRLYDDKLLNTAIVIPSLTEQNQILTAIEQGTGSLDRAIALTRRHIGTANEYCTRLIADVVTGKLDVRAVAAGLPEEDEEAGALEEMDALGEGEEITDDIEDASEEAAA